MRAAARQLEISDSTLYRWVNSGILPSVRPDVPGAPVRIRMGAGFRSRFHLDPQRGSSRSGRRCAALACHARRSGKGPHPGQLESCHVKRGGVRGLYVRLKTDELPLFEERFRPSTSTAMRDDRGTVSFRKVRHSRMERQGPHLTADDRDIAVPGTDSPRDAASRGLAATGGRVDQAARSAFSAFPPAVLTV